jgi:cell division septation protein DedD
MAGALARSLDWLNREYTLGSKKKAQKIYADLVNAGATQLPGPGDSAAAAEGKRLSAKQTYVNQEFGGKVVTKTWDPGTNVDTPTGMTESGGDFAVWLKAEWEAEDVELAFRSTGFAHIVTLTEVAENADGSFKVKFRDDAQQRDGNGGDNGPKNGKIFQSGGTWYFGNTNFPLQFAISESPVTPTPTPTPTLTPTPIPTPTPPPSPTSTPTAPPTATPSPSGTPN